MTLIEVKQCENKNLVFQVKDVEKLRKMYRIVGSLCGTLPGFPLQNTFYGLPLSLSSEELDVLLSQDAITIKNANTEVELPKRNDIFRYFWSLNFYITNGHKFGGDYLLYPGDPMCFHSQFIVSVKQLDQSFLASDLVLMGRLATNVKKTYVLAASIDTQEDEKKTVSFLIEWAGF